MAEEGYNKGLEYFGAKQTAEAAIAWKQASDWGNPKAMCDLGWMYSQQGLGVTKDESMAFQWMLKSAEKGVSPSNRAVANTP